MLRRTLLFAAILVGCTLPVSRVAADAQATWVYVDPRPNAEYVSAGTTIALRQGKPLDPASLQSLTMNVEGSLSGQVSGTLKLSSDHSTLIFTPQRSFLPGETVRVNVPRGIRTETGASLEALTYSFQVSSKAIPTLHRPAGWEQELTPPTRRAGRAASPPYVTAPSDISVPTVLVASNGTAPGYIFVDDLIGSPTIPLYLLIFDDNAELVYYKALPPGHLHIDFKVQPTGQLTYWDGSLSKFFAMDNTYQVVKTYQAGNGYAAETDNHELLLEPNGHAVLLVYDHQTVDMSAIVAGGDPKANVIGLVLQELDEDGNVVFQWRSWDHFQITDTYESLTTHQIDYVHTNSAAITNDGNLMISNRHMSEVTKIDRMTGNIIWRFGGKNNQFTLLNGEPTSYQHDARQLPNGHYTVFDNGNQRMPPYSRGVEYALDEQNMTATQVWEQRHTPDLFGGFVGSNRRLSNGNALISWGNQGRISEYRPDGSLAMEWNIAGLTYRTFRQEWKGNPQQPPDLTVQDENGASHLYYSWNGATEVAMYRVLAGSERNNLREVELRERTGFETSSLLGSSDCFFQVQALGTAKNVLGSSLLVQKDTVACQRWYQHLPLSVQP